MHVLHLLHNRFFIGEVKYRGEILPGEQPDFGLRADQCNRLRG